MEEVQLESDKSNRLVLKDFITVAIFSAIYLLGIMIVGMPLDLLVVTAVTYPFFAALFLGVPSMLVLAKVPKPFAIFIYAIIPAFVSSLMGDTLITMVHGVIIAILAEIIRKLMGYKTIKGNIVSYAVMSLFTCGSFWQLYILADQHRANVEKMMGPEYTDYVKQFFSLPIWIMPIMYVTCILGGIIGGLLGVKILKKHFVKAGIV